MLKPHVDRACRVCRPRKRPGQSDQFTYSLVLPFEEKVQFDAVFYIAAPEFGLGGDTGIPIVHVIDCCIRWSVRVKPQSSSTRYLLERIILAWAIICGGMKALSFGGDRCEL